MSEAAKCPVCEGSGRYVTCRPVEGNNPPDETDCHGCNGRGWVELTGFGWNPPVIPKDAEPGRPETTWGWPLPEGPTCGGSVVMTVGDDEQILI